MSKNYVENEDLLREIKKMKKTGKMSEELGEMLMKIGNGLVNTKSFYGYTWKEDMVSFGLLTLVKYLKNFDETKYSNPFAYIDTVFKRAFLTYIKQHKKHSEIKDKCWHRHTKFQEDEMFSLKGINYEEISDKNFYQG